MARANMMGWAMLVVVMMALYIGKAEAWPCAYDCAREHAEEHGGSWSDYIIDCVGDCREHSPPRLSSIDEAAKASPQLAKALELLSQAPELHQEMMKSRSFLPHLKHRKTKRLP